ncbi:exodeoxyribonuclease V subunit beta [Neisseria lactamica]|uniref:exodeoxyribonuclease V subunit beta n=1 Tax=Neisseria lactamica TaxID=486 RepID=UPI0004985102|nr:exodeoxyribonuclease V subunit beta [Neisseria lactamica]
MSAPIQAFDPLTVPIAGTNLIEASAGTGKTYGIAALFTRLIVLEQKNVERVLVVTFTKAATAELKTRLRARLDDVLQVLESKEIAKLGDDTLSDGIAAYCAEHHEGDTFLPALLKQALQKESRTRLIVRLKAAIGQFDNAAIYTIHGFCQRILRDYAFLCQAPFDVELTEEDGNRLLVPAQDFWRERVSNNPVLAELVFKRKTTPQTVLAQISRYLSRPYLHFRIPQTDLPQARDTALATWQNICENLTELKETFWRIHPLLNGSVYQKNSFTKLFDTLEQKALSPDLPFFEADLHERLLKLSSDKLEAKLKKGKSPDEAAFADLQRLANLARDLDALEEAEEATMIRLQLDLIEYLNRSLAEMKKTRRERGFDDLLLDVHTALTDNPHGETLARAVAENWETALIDEFQDTDPLQYEIFQKIFIAQNRPLFLVGDPKQAIYSFRGADIYAYLQAAGDARHRYTLSTNYRSHAALIGSIGALFRLKERPFVLENIAYTDVGAARTESRLSPERAAVQIRWLHGEDTEKTNKDALRRRAADYCADEIAHALNEAAEGRLNFKGSPLQSGDIAVLVRTHNEAVMVSAALKKRQVQSVLLSRESVFASPEAAALSALIGFWLEPRRTGTLRFALTSSIFGYNAQQLHDFNQNESEILHWAESARNALDIWQKYGIFAAMQQFSQTHGIETRLLSRNNGRSLTNYFQLLELLAAEDAQNRNPAALHKWLRDQISLAENNSNDNRAIRLESDEDLVKIVTMHASKGLQYPLVYCPFAWDAQDTGPSDWQILHQSANRTELLAKAQLSEDEQKQYADEEMAERLRLLYVALTRAEEQLNIYAAYSSDTADNPLAYLIEGLPQDSRETVRRAYACEKDGIAMLKRNWRRLADNAPSGTNFAFTEDAPPPAVYCGNAGQTAEFAANSIPDRGFRFVRHTSFTALSRHTQTPDGVGEDARPSLDSAETSVPAMPSETPPASDGISIHDFPKGTQAGLCLHEILEHFPFDRPAAGQETPIADTLKKYGFEEIWLPAVAEMAEACRKTPLTGTYSLSDISPEYRCPEMGFTLFTEDFSLKRLRDWFARDDIRLPEVCRAAAETLDFHTVNGFLNGFIDMVCQDPDGNICVIDYKSNYLGADASAYTQQAMDEAVAHHHYYLQALIYAVAAARYFKLRGQPPAAVSVRYLFLRGTDGKGGGVWRWDIDAAALDRIR